MTTANIAARAKRRFKLGPQIEEGWHVQRAAEPKHIVLCIAYAFNFLPPPVIETIYNIKDDTLSMRTVQWERS